jgi:hypothetical protein
MRYVARAIYGRWKISTGDGCALTIEASPKLLDAIEATYRAMRLQTGIAIRES